MRLRDLDFDPRCALTPAADVVFLILAFLACLAGEWPEAKLRTWLPKDEDSYSDLSESRRPLELAIVVERVGTERTVRYALGPKRLDELDALIAALHRVAAEPDHLVPSASGAGWVLRPVEVRPGVGATVQDAVTAFDAARSAGFTRVVFAGSAGPSGR